MALFSRALSRRRANLLKLSIADSHVCHRERILSYVALVRDGISLPSSSSSHSWEIDYTYYGENCVKGHFITVIIVYSTGIHQEEALFMAFLFVVGLSAQQFMAQFLFLVTTTTCVTLLKPQWFDMLGISSDCLYVWMSLSWWSSYFTKFCMIPTFFALLLWLFASTLWKRAENIIVASRNALLFAKDLSLRVSFYLSCHHQFHKNVFVFSSIPFRNVVSLQWYSCVVSCWLNFADSDMVRIFYDNT